MFTERLKAGTWFGFAEVDIEIPQLLWMKFEEMPPFFFKKQIPAEVVPRHMLEYLKQTGGKRGDGKKLMGTLSAEKLLLYPPLYCIGMSTRDSYQSHSSHDRLSGHEDLHLVREAGDRGLPHRRYRQEQGAAR